MIVSNVDFSVLPLPHLIIITIIILIMALRSRLPSLAPARSLAALRRHKGTADHCSTVLKPPFPAGWITWAAACKAGVFRAFSSVQGVQQCSGRSAAFRLLRVRSEGAGITEPKERQRMRSFSRRSVIPGVPWEMQAACERAEGIRGRGTERCVVCILRVGGRVIICSGITARLPWLCSVNGFCASWRVRGCFWGILRSADL